MSIGIKKVYWFVVALIFAAAMILTLMPVEVFAAEPLDPVIASQVIRADSLPAAGAAYEGKYYDINGKVYACPAPGTDPVPVYEGFVFTGNPLIVVSSLPYDDIVSDSANYITTFSSASQGTVYAILQLSTNTYVGISNKNVVFFSYSESSGFTTLQFQSYTSSGSSFLSFNIMAGYTILNVPENTSILDMFMCIDSTYRWKLIHEHNLIEYVMESATCDAPGVKTIGCTVCDVYDIYGEEFAIPQLTHNWVETSRKQECSIITVVRSCSHCGDTETETMPGPGHAYSSQYYEETPEELGHTVFTCNVCSYTYTVYDTWNCSVKGHKWFEEHRSDNCDTTTIEYRCAACNAADVVTEPGGKGHLYNEISRTGYCGEETVIYQCVNCDHVYTDIDTSRVHDYVEVTRTGNCERAEITYVCDVCDHSYVYILNGAHKFNEVSRTGSCTEDTVITSRCGFCEEVKTETIKATGHKYEEILRTETCASITSTKSCTVCDHSYTETLPGIGHVNTIDTKIEDGYRIKTYTCKNCGYVTTESTPISQVPETSIEDVEKFILNFFGSIASFFLYILANVSFVGISGMDMLGVLLLILLFVFIRRLTAKE